ncbi:MAG: hypothetical protein LH473_13860 [Chitinophagales bacterium]|nr:hypothetical protein [Chitinophagales bacterium]
MLPGLTSAAEIFLLMPVRKKSKSFPPTQGLLTNKHIALGSFGRRIRAKRGSGVAIKAIARKIACYYYRAMTKGEAFVEKGIELYETQLKEHQKKYLERMAIKLKMQLVPL